jgi:hypothetical protein
VSEAMKGTLFGRLNRARLWILLQFVLTLVLILAGLAWTRLPDKHIWQVALSLLVPVLLMICALELEAGTMRKLADDDGKRVKLVWGAMALLVWVAIGAATWALLDWCDDQIPLWAGYLNSRFGAHARATTFTFEHIQRWLTELEWVVRWIVLPAKLIPHAAASAQWGWKIPWRRILRFLWNWRWWLGVVLASVLGVWLPGEFFDKAPSGTVSGQVWSVVFKLAAAYVLTVGSWVLLLGWWATLFVSRKKPPAEEALVAVPVLSGPPLRGRSAKADVPPPDDDIPA